MWTLPKNRNDKFFSHKNLPVSNKKESDTVSLS